MLRDLRLKALSDREGQIMLLAADGLTDKEIAAHLNISAGSIRTYWDRMRLKLGAKSRGEIIAKALREAYQEAETTLKQAEEWIHLFVDNIQDYAIFSLTPDRVLETWNPGVKRIFGYTEDEWIGQQADIIFLPEDREAGVPLMEVQRAQEEGQVPARRLHLKKDGARIWADGMMVALRDEGGNLVGMAKIVQDQTELKLAQEKLEQRTRELEQAEAALIAWNRQLVDTRLSHEKRRSTHEFLFDMAPIPLIATDQIGSILHVNAAARDLFGAGVDKAKLLVDQVTPDDHHNYRTVLIGAAQDSRQVTTLTFGTQGAPINAEVTVIAMVDSDQLLWHIRQLPSALASASLTLDLPVIL